MNDEVNISDDQLRRATERRLANDAVLDPGTAALREGFVLLGKSAERLASEADDAALVARLQDWCASQESDRRLTRPAKLRETSPWQLALAAALALSILIAAVWQVREWPAKPATAVSPQPAQGSGDVVRQEAQQFQSPEANVPGSSVREKSALPRYAAAWQDSLDYEIASAQAGMQSLSEERRGLDGSLSDMRDRLQSLSQQWWGEPL